ncbi:3379_t:CDS:2 [Dentiscutata heterogama]|uniref:3379_t:CDS:1 n=1 Tax=Dentiscutata heterogama TaxID=1316150 RepID=A0ACA9LM17_9GLOM|nr:3379_t:CDS:2 [Dentiscutata heterogama]
MDEQSLALAEDCELTEFKGESLLDPINRLKELLYSQSSSILDSSSNVNVPESDLETHNSPKTSSVEAPPSFSNVNSTHIVTNLSTANALQAPSSNNDTLNLTLKKRSVPPVALISADIRQIRSRAQRINAYSAKFELLKKEDTGLCSWLNLNLVRELPLSIKTDYKKRFNETIPSIASLAANKIYSNLSLATSASSQPTLSSRTSDNSTDTNILTNSSSQNSSKSLSFSRTFLDAVVQTNSPKSHPMSPPMSPKTKTSSNLFNLNRRGSISKPNRPMTHMPPAVMNDPSTNSSASSTSMSPKSPKTASPKRQRRFSFQAVSSKFFGSSSTPSLPFPTIEEKTDTNSSNSVVIDEDALNRLCDVLPQADRDVLIKYLRAAGGKDDLMAVGLYMKDLKSGEI